MRATELAAPVRSKSGCGNPGLWLAVVLLFVVHAVFAAVAGLTDDEAYYRLWSLAPALSYYDHPPVVAWLIAAGRALAGDTELGLRLFAPLLLALGAAVQWRTALLLTNSETARTATWFFVAMPLLSVGGVIVTPDLPSVLFYGLVVCGLAELERTQNANWWLAVGLAAGFGMVSKYTNLFAGVTILVWVLAVPINRKWLASPQFWLGGIIALLVKSPVLIWNWQHGGASFAKQFGRAGHGAEFGVRYPLELIGGVLGLASPMIAGLAAIGLVSVTLRACDERDSRMVLLAAAIVPLLAYFAVHALHDRVQANWLAPLYPPLAICAAVGLNTAAETSRRRLSRWAVALGLVMTALIYVHAIWPVVQLQKDPSSQMRGWPEFSGIIEKLRQAHGAEWVATSSYATAGQLSFALRHVTPVAQLNDRIRHEHLPALPRERFVAAALYVELERRVGESMLAECFAQAKRVAMVRRDDGTAGGADYAVYALAGAAETCAGETGPPHAAPILPVGTTVPK
ncbi:MAG: glycosyltransferase family 39 protein [Hyphomicrobium sp.]